jgi:hypothetical protein
MDKRGATQAQQHGGTKTERWKPTHDVSPHRWMLSAGNRTGHVTPFLEKIHIMLQSERLVCNKGYAASF